MNKKLLLEAVIKYLLGIVMVGALLFIPAGTLDWKNGWIFMAVLFIPMLLAGLVMYFKAPNLLRSRLNAKEKQKTQQGVIKYSGLMFLAAFIVAGLNFRFKWNTLPQFIVYAGIALFLVSYAMFGEVLRENEYLSRTIEVQEGQQVVTTGLYRFVRHPMYSATVFLFLSMPLILNSLWSFVIMLTYIPLILARIKNEEEVLERELEGYTEYKKKVRYKIIPNIL